MGCGLAFRGRIPLEQAAQAADIAELESALGVTIPDALRALYLTSDGVFDDPGQVFMIWPLGLVQSRNQESWESSSGHGDGLLAFGDGGTGAPFCVPADGAAGVFVWSPIDGAATRLADDVRSFWAAWTAGPLPPH